MASANQSSIITRAPEMSSRGSSVAFGQTLQFITSIKLQELEKQRLAFQEHAQVLQKTEACGDNLIEKVELLLEAVETWSGSGSLGLRSTLGGKLNLANLRRWLPQAKQDPNFSADILRSWIDTLETHIRHNVLRFDCAKLFGNLFNEWIASGDSSTALPTSEDAAGAPDAGEGFEKLERLKSIIFEEAQIDVSALEAYLSDLFSSEEATKALEALKKEVVLLQNMVKRQTFTAPHVGNLVRGLLAEGLMDEAQRATLAEFLDNPTVLTEVASVLTMRMASIETWKWQEEGIVVEMRRHLNGKYRAFTDPEIIDALLLQHIGISWQVKLKSAFIRVLDSKAWKRKPVEDKELAIYQNLLAISNTIDGCRLNQQRQSFFVTQLASSMANPSTSDDLVDTPGINNADSPAAIKQRLLRMMATEAQLNSTLYGTHSVVRSDFEWFFGVSDEWTSFFQRFLRMPLRFKGDPAGQVRTRLRGTPISYALSVVCGEALLFVMDFAVNQKADGLFLYRMHDDLWLWDADAAKCAAGWKEMNIYANLVGLKFNASKTGSASVGTDSPTGLPEGDICWGFLHFDPSKARFVINQKDVDVHIKELRWQLSSTKSVFGWVNAYNKYMAFFLRNFGGRPATCFGKIHVQDILDTIARIQKELFPDVQGGAVAHLRSVIEERFGMLDLPQGYFYLPISNGGLELRHPMIEMFALPQSFDYDTDGRQGFDALLKTDGERYKELKDIWDRGFGKPGHYNFAGIEFMSFEQYASLRETRLGPWGICYEYMLHITPLQSLEATPLAESFLSQSKPDMKWEYIDWYQQWILSLYGEEVVKRFGSWEVVDPSLIPVGMAQLFRTSRMKLDE
ncbi:hypothetical protein H0H92_009380 [Tricholoma furcatifolium]|nr:hypothetical protein H0H92_009380 [Tricholoma furcatifolium]